MDAAGVRNASKYVPLERLRGGDLIRRNRGSSDTKQRSAISTSELLRRVGTSRSAACVCMCAPMERCLQQRIRSERGVITNRCSSRPGRCSLRASLSQLTTVVMLLWAGALLNSMLCSTEVLSEHMVYTILSTSLTLFRATLSPRGERDALEGAVSDGREGELHP